MIFVYNLNLSILDVTYSHQFSCYVSRILKVLEVVAPFKHFNKLKEFVAMKLPAGFPVRIGWSSLILVFAVVTWVVTQGESHTMFLLARKKSGNVKTWHDNPRIGCEGVFLFVSS